MNSLPSEIVQFSSWTLAVTHVFQSPDSEAQRFFNICTQSRMKWRPEWFTCASPMKNELMTIKGRNDAKIKWKTMLSTPAHAWTCPNTTLMHYKKEQRLRTLTLFMLKGFHAKHLLIQQEITQLVGKCLNENSFLPVRSAMKNVTMSTLLILFQRRLCNS